MDWNFNGHRDEFDLGMDLYILSRLMKEDRNQTVNVCVGIIRDDDKILIIRRGTSQSYAGCYEFPGAVINPGESETEALKRGLRNCLGIGAEIGRRITEVTKQVGSQMIHMSAYDIIGYSGTIQLSLHNGMDWVPVNEFRKRYDMTPVDKLLSMNLNAIY